MSVDQEQPPNGDLEAIALNGVHHSKKLDDIATNTEAHVVAQDTTTKAVNGLEPALDAIVLNTKRIGDQLEEEKNERVADEHTVTVRGLKGEKGDKGDTGDQGPQGEVGPKGDSITGPQGDQGGIGPEG